MTSTRRPLVVVGLVYFEVVVQADDFEVVPGQEVFVDRMSLRLGGALNTASVAHALGHRTTLMYPTGEGLGDLAIATRVAGLGIASRTWPGCDDGAISLVQEGTGERSFVSFADYEALGRCPALPFDVHIHVPGLKEASVLAPRLAEARARGATVSVSGSWVPELLDALRSGDVGTWDLLILNEAEAVRSADSVAGALEALRDVARDVVVTLGPDGARGRVDDIGFEASGEHATVEDVTGAGDAFCAGFITGRLAGRGGGDAAALAIQAASRQIASVGGVATDPSRYQDLRFQS